ncbi:hypothetical protein BU23DRAFT_67280 [Bimuria novae-zelandiae CBS 107.79]|uniref:Uncharacterized protein n=1 Tax=Bimuria novae-zelandiae CBS 107.79 TaxID=1447943 RepID=A0A6A5VL84_9PLEO|nr:hypothetical protein BU23DRAFT_67280 [Bimuria novae-zelandiae CBS 107.79]
MACVMVMCLCRTQISTFITTWCPYLSSAARLSPLHSLQLNSLAQNSARSAYVSRQRSNMTPRSPMASVHLSRCTRGQTPLMGSTERPTRYQM